MSVVLPVAIFLNYLQINGEPTFQQLKAEKLAVENNQIALEDYSKNQELLFASLH